MHFQQFEMTVHCRTGWNITFNQPNHLIDVPMVKTAIHAHAGSREAIRATIEKIQGKSAFQGTFNDNVFCGSFDTRL